MNSEQVYEVSFDDSLTGVKKFMSNVYAWMAMGILLTAISALITVKTGLIISIVKNQLLFYALILGELGMVFFLSARLWKMSIQSATASYFAYSILNGITLSTIFLAFAKSSIASVFFITAGMFAAMSLYGMTTKTDLTKWSKTLFMALIGIVIASVVNIFLKNNMMDWIISYAGVILFSALTAYDTNKLKNLYLANNFTAESSKKMAIFGALQLYLDFINLFLFLLRIFGGNRD